MFVQGSKWCGVVLVVLVSGRCGVHGMVFTVVAARRDVEAVVIYTGDGIVVAADKTGCRESSW